MSALLLHIHLMTDILVSISFLFHYLAIINPTQCSKVIIGNIILKIYCKREPNEDWPYHKSTLKLQQTWSTQVTNKYESLTWVSPSLKSKQTLPNNIVSTLLYTLVIHYTRRLNEKNSTILPSHARSLI